MSIWVRRAITRRWWLWRNRNAFVAQLPPAKPRLLVDVSTIVRFDAGTGIQRVVRAVWAELRRRGDLAFDLQPVFASFEHGYCYVGETSLQSGELPNEPEVVAVRPGDIFLGLDFTAQYLPHYRSQLRAWRQGGAGIHLILYDLLPIFNPEWFSLAGRKNYGRWFSVLLQEADQAICISRFVASELRRITDGSSRPRIACIQLAGDIENSLPSAGVDPLVERAIHRMQSHPAILMAGTIEPRKGHDVALAAFEHLWRQDGMDAPDLVIVGKPGWKTEQLQQCIRTHPEAGRRLHWLDRVSDEGLCRLYEASHGFLMASRGEGLGLPLVEAAMHGCPILARDLPVFREQALPGVRYFQDDRPEPLAAEIRELLSSPRPVMPKASDLPCWRATVDQLLRALEVPSRGTTLRAPIAVAS